MRVIACINVLLWGAFIWIGSGLVDDATGRGIHGFPNNGQTMYYLYFPISMLILAISAYGFSRFRRMWYLGMGIEVLQLVALVPFFLGYTGGV